MTSRHFYLLWAVLPILPFILGFGVLAIFDGPTSELTKALDDVFGSFPVDDKGVVKGAIYYEAARDLRFMNAFFIYLSVGFFHLTACVGVIAYMAYRIWGMPDETRHRTLVVLGLSLLILGLANWMARWDVFIGGLSLAYRNICDVIYQSGVAGQIMPEEGCKSSGISNFAWLAAIPYLFGLLAAACASAVVSGVVSDTSMDISERAERVRRAFQATTFVLVTSVMALVLFYKLPLSIVEDSTSTGLITNYAQGITMFWGTLFTVTLVAIFGPANLALAPQLKEEATVDGEKLFIDADTRKMAITVLTTLSPLLVGSAGSFLETIASAISGG